MHHNKRDFTSQPLLQKQAKIIQLLEQSGYVDSSRISKEIIEFTGGDLEKIDIVLADIAANKPWEYIRGWTIFDGNKIKVSKDTLIPRVETEDLVEAAEAAILDLLQRYQEKISIIDLGTGSGAVIISLYKRLLVQRIRVKFLASDVSISVLDVVRANISENLIKPEAIELIQSDLLADLKFQHKTVFIVANLPYIPVTEMSDLEPSVKEYEPRLALDGGEDGINIYKRLFDQLKEQSKKHSFSGIIETHSRSINQLAEYVRQSYSSVQILPDRFNRPRFIKCS
ncbi:peptide chain release factor N(5)-glutamine methyltransferase [Candidatus Nomurabacteria bacterium]|nr:peptide chain release factor N(5)-glutamine methyltransferase [Candidatus Nomurabacteria bacterium]